MQVFKSIKRVIVFSIFITFGFSLFAQVDMPEMPSMPEISMPKLGDSFYVPSLPSLTPKPVTNTTVKEDGSDIVKETTLSDGTTTEDLLRQLLSGDDFLTASDISSLYDTGRFTNISSLGGFNLGTDYSSSSTNVLLQRVLASLEDLKQEQKNSTAAQKQQDSNQQKDNQTFRTRDPAVLRFRINGYSIKESLTEVFFSEAEADGSFLLTADRKYFVNQNPYTETFYFLFKSVKSTGTVTTYEVTPSIVQNKKNTNSFVYKLCNKKNITAEKTGNLVVLHFSDNDVNADMLLDIDKK